MLYLQVLGVLKEMLLSQWELSTVSDLRSLVVVKEDKSHLQCNDVTSSFDLKLRS